jgi:plastocyanin
MRSVQRQGIAVLGLAVFLAGASLLAPAQTSRAQSSEFVFIGPDAYSPAILTVTVGARVAWINNDSVDHTATSDTGAWDTGTIPGVQARATHRTLHAHRHTNLNVDSHLHANCHPNGNDNSLELRRAVGACREVRLEAGHDTEEATAQAGEGGHERLSLDLRGRALGAGWL